MPGFDRVLRQLTLANDLTFLRLAAIPALVLALLGGHTSWALAIFVGAAITDRLDGIAARRLGQQTELGAFLDPAADKLMMLATYVTLALPDRPRVFPDYALDRHLPAWLAVLVVTRDVIIVLIALGLYVAYGQTKFAPLRIGKWNTGSEMVTGGLFLLANVWPGLPDQLLAVATAATAALLVASGLAYLVHISRAQRRRDAQPIEDHAHRT